MATDPRVARILREHPDADRAKVVAALGAGLKPAQAAAIAKLDEREAVAYFAAITGPKG